MNESKMRIVLMGDTWMCDSSQASDAHVIRDLFGTTLLPSSFRAPMPGHEVVERIQALNPEHIVWLDDPRDYPRSERRLPQSQ